MGLSHTSIPAFDLTAACSGFNYAVTTAQQYLLTGQANCVCVIGVDTLSYITDWADRGTCVLFGDGAGAVIMKRVSDPYGVSYSKLFSNGAIARCLTVEHPPETDSRAMRVPGYPSIYMDGRAVFKTAVDLVVPTIVSACEEAQITPNDCDWIVLHQANKRILDAVKSRLDVDPDKVVMNVDRFGNTSAASIPLALGELAFWTIKIWSKSFVLWFWGWFYVGCNNLSMGI